MKHRLRYRLSVIIVAACLFGNVGAQEARALRVFSSNGVRSVLEEAVPRLETVAGMPLVLELSTARTLTERLQAGGPFDVAILTPELIDALIETGRIRAEQPVTFARVGVGVGVRQAFPAIDPTGPDGLRRVLLAAESVAYGANGQSRETNEAALATLGIAERVRPKVRLTGPGEAPRLVAAGDVDVVLTLVSELVNEPGLRYLGPFPDDLQGYIYFAAGIAVEAAEPAAAEALIDFLGSAELAGALGAHGLETVAR